MRSTRTIIDMYLTEARNRQLSPKTIVGYDWALSKLEAAFPDSLPDDPTVLLDFMGRQKLSQTSRHDLWRATRTFWRWAVRNSLANDVMESVPAPRTRPTIPRAFTEDEVARLLAVPKIRRDMALLALPLDTGIRVGELASLKRSSMRRNSLIVSGKVGERTVPISPSVLKLLSDLGDGDHLWVGRQGPMTLLGIQTAIRKLLYQARILPPKAGPHTLRHTFALNYIRRGGDVFSLQRILGHRNVSTTMIYVHMSTEHLIEQHAKYSPMSDYCF